MSLGTPRPRNWGKDEQKIALALLLERNKVAYRIRNSELGPTLWLAASANGTTLPFIDCCANLVHARRLRWEARHPFDDRLLAVGCSKLDVVRATIQAAWR